MLRRYAVCSVMLLVFVGYASAQPRRSRPGTIPSQPRQVLVTQQLVEQMMRDDAIDRECVELANGRFDELFSASAIDLNRDGRPELNLIGTGCACRGARRCMWWIYRQTANGYEQILDGVPAEDITPLRTSTNGNRDLRVSMWAGANDMVAIIYRFDGSRYRDDYVPPRRPVAPRGRQRPTSDAAPASPRPTTVASDYLSQLGNAKPRGLTLGKLTLVDGYALQEWGTEHTGGQALLRFSPSSRTWVLVDDTGGMWDVDSLMAKGVPRAVAALLVKRSLEPPPPRHSRRRRT